MKDINKRVENQFLHLHLKGLIGVYRHILDKAIENKLSYIDFLSLLLEEEVQRKQEASIKAKVNRAKFPFLKTIEAFDFSYQPALNEQQILKISSLEFIEKKENVIFLGPPALTT